MMYMKKRQVRFGVNYVPSRNWWYCWSDWDKNAIEEDLKAIAGIGMDHIRIHCLWPVFQPNPGYVSETALRRLEELLDIADQNNLDVIISVLDGWLSGFAFIPAWVGSKNIFIDRDMIHAEKLLFKEINDYIGRHKRFYGFDVGNEINVLTGFGHAISSEDGDKWAREILGYCKEIAPDKLHVNGVDHAPWIGNHCFSRRNIATQGDLSAVHAWTYFAGVFKKYSALDVGSTHFAEFMAEIANAYKEDDDRQVWLQEFGASHLWMKEEVMPVFAEKTILNVLSCDCLWGVTWWCSHDIDQKFTHFSELEYGLGLLDIHNRLKPVGNTIKQLIKKCNDNMPDAIKRDTAIVLSESMFDLGENDIHRRDGWKAAKVFFESIEKGIRPAFVLESKALNKAHLAARGIDTLIHL